jgi:hypothetical protein
MRAVWVGLVGVMMVTGAAQAGVCRLDGLEMIAESREPAVLGKTGFSYPVDRADLVGKTFRVVRSSSNFWRIKPGVPGDLRDDGSIFVLVQSGGEQFVIKQVYNGNAGPQEMGYSFLPADNAAKAFKWDHRALDAEAARFGGFFDVYDGPLNGLVLKSPTCN